MKDLIDRQAAIDALFKWYEDEDDDRDAVDVICGLPSAQPEPCDDPRADVYYLAEKIGIHRLYELVVELRGEPEPCEDAVSREAVSEWLKQYGQDVLHGKYKFSLMYIWKNFMDLPSVQPDRDIPMKPLETTDKAWGIPRRQAVCPKCDCYLGHVAFLGDYKGKRVTYCETCGQAIDWEGWEGERNE